MNMRIYYKELGGHTHIRVFTARSAESQHDMAGRLTMTNEEFKDFQSEVESIEANTDQRYRFATFELLRETE